MVGKSRFVPRVSEAASFHQEVFWQRRGHVGSVSSRVEPSRSDGELAAQAAELVQFRDRSAGDRVDDHLAAERRANPGRFR
ncbi:hypothetical protein AEGHOMDF_2144 [Methylobacterium soli]|nr:hypothetical protein AEGHOMDF_2144 [Methylobacterium soli]